MYKTKTISKQYFQPGGLSEFFSVHMALLVCWCSCCQKDHLIHFQSLYSLPSALSHSPQAFSEPFAFHLECQAQSSFWCAYLVVGSRCPEHFLYLLIRHAAYVLWLHFNQGSHCVPRRLRPILWNLQGFWLEDVKHIFKACMKYAYICWSTSALKETQQSL